MDTQILWSDVLRQSFQDIWTGVANFLPQLIVALLIVIIGWAVGAIIENLVERAARAVKLDNVLKGARVENVVNKAGFQLNSGAFIGGLVKWFVIVIFLIAAFQVLGLTQVNEFLQDVVLKYLPKVIVAALILIVAAVIADVVQKLVTGTARAAGIISANFVGSVAKWAIWIFAIMAALTQLGIIEPLIQTLFTGIVVALSLAFGLAFGLGGHDAAARYIEKMREEIKQHRT
ncbi:MAG: hypothetical protein A3G59_01585 [Candidatus Taylorbacteria bacterium RIFCSPLOWO2_12_FULL_47_20]|uniref:Small-conductance mechanosensitive ion channel n=1 Tax=Candidatus Taylorbacteria bacterium RIFCSPLOWO2_12_FULL_47_20 TaxID=1802335 RepID=A0A1G2P6E7_9BACT|nr:MAG: hypothetical protein A3G59_01585 [Candidatus Taylorbacteria bacterium RIFCSPLOWO2_12_FULL_47_20]